MEAEAHAALARVARLAGDPPGLREELERLVATYMAERSLPPAPRVGELYAQMRRRVQQAEAMRRLLKSDAWIDRHLREIEEPPLVRFPGYDLDFLLATEARRCRVAAERLDPEGRRRADCQPGSPRWRLLWGLAKVWQEHGNYVARGPSTRFFAFASEVMLAAGEHVPQRMVDEVAKRWRASLTEEAEKSGLPSLAA